MSRSHKARYGTTCETWKDTVLASRSQKRAWARRKRLRTQRDRARRKVHDETELRSTGDGGAR